MKRQMLFAFLIATIMIAGIFPNVKAATNPDMETQPVTFDNDGDIAVAATEGSSSDGNIYGDTLLSNPADDDKTSDTIEQIWNRHGLTVNRYDGKDCYDNVRDALRQHHFKYWLNIGESDGNALFCPHPNTNEPTAFLHYTDLSEVDSIMNNSVAEMDACQICSH